MSTHILHRTVLQDGGSTLLAVNMQKNYFPLALSTSERLRASLARAIARTPIRSEVMSPPRVW